MKRESKLANNLPMQSLLMLNKTLPKQLGYLNVKLLTNFSGIVSVLEFEWQIIGSSDSMIFII